MATGQFATVLRHIRQMIEPRAAVEQTDGQLLHRFVHHHEQAAFTTLVERHGPMVLGVCRRVLSDPHDADDAFQATFLVLVRKAGSLKQWGSLGNWLYTVARHLAVRTQAQGAKRRARESEVVEVPAPADRDPAWQELRPVLDSELDRLPARYRTPVVLCYLEGKTNEEAAQELGCPVGTVKCRLSRARDMLRDRLARRGVTLGAALLAPKLAEQASATVPSALLQITTEAATLVAAGNALAAGSVSVRAAVLAEGAMKTMFLTKLKTVAALLVVLGLVGTGAGALLSHAPGGQQRPGSAAELPFVAAAPAGAAADSAPAAKDNRANDVKTQRRLVNKRLAQTIDFPGFEANTPLKDALEFLSQKFDVTITIDSDAFAEIGVQKAEEQSVQLPKMKNARLSVLLRRLLSQIRGDRYQGTYVVRPEGVEVTTTYHQIVEALGEEPRSAGGGLPAPEPSNNAMFEYFGENGRRQTPVVQVDYDKQSLAEVLHDLAAETRIDVVIDPRVADKARVPVTLTLNNVFLDTTLNVLMEMSELDWVWMDKIVYVTTKENAKLRRDKAKALQEERAKLSALNQAPLAPAAPPMEPPVKRVDVSVNQQPLNDVLQNLANANGINVVIDAGVGDKAKRLVTATLNSVPLETAVRLLADMGDLRPVLLDGVFYVTTREKAKALQDQSPPKESKPAAASTADPALPRPAAVLPPPPYPGGGPPAPM
ncbi:MAG: sigma-70 family RNA polymerase sigma factor [Gemmataceae bacterium]|nr:sigma-70 family RNA polymerase sigma factor [Gemmataceae bacterium]